MLDKNQPVNGPLTGVLVADFSRVLAGPYATMMLGDLGATVIKVESPLGDDTRAWKPPSLNDQATYYLSVNRNKKSVQLDLKDSSDRLRAHRLAKAADVLVENFMPGSLKRYGLDYETVARDNPSIVYGTITGFGDGKGSTLPGYDLVAQAVSGLMSITGPKDGLPYKSGVAIVDVVTGLHLAVAVLAALDLRSRTGVGQHVSVNLLGAALAAMVNQSSSYLATGVSPTRMGNAHPSLFPYEPLKTMDGYLVVAVGNDSQFGRLCDAINASALATDERFRTNQQRVLNRETLKPLIEERLASDSASNWSKILTNFKVPCGPINSIGEGVALADAFGLDPVVQLIDSNGITTPSISNPMSFSKTPPTYRNAPPQQDEHGDQIRSWLDSLNEG